MAIQISEQTDFRPLAPVLPDIPALCVNSKNAALLTTDGEIQILPHAQIRPLIRGQNILVCHAPYTRSRLDFQDFHALDVLELFAFVSPTRFCAPTPAGLARALALDIPDCLEDAPLSLFDITRSLLRELQHDPLRSKADPCAIAAIMAQKGKGWAWTSFIFESLGKSYNPQEDIFSKATLNIWKHLPEWAESAPAPPPSHYGVSAEEAQERLSELLTRGDKKREIRPQQKEYAATIAQAFSPVNHEDEKHIVLCEAGTGTGKTLGYIAPASLWAEKNEGAVWISTYTKNLQQQIDSELDRLYPHPVVKDSFVAMRKGRENYLCLLNYEDLAAGAALSHNPRHAVAAGIMARWIAATKDGDLSGSDFPGWLASILGLANTYGLSDRRGECIFSACDHYHRCFVERSIRKSKRARLVIANHALVMIQSAMASSVDALPTRYIFDEGHHLFDAADSAFAAHLTAKECADLRRWILGAEDGGRKSRARGLKRRLEDLITNDDEATVALQDTLHAARHLPAYNWSHRFKDNAPSGAAEVFLHTIHSVIHARNAGAHDTPYSLETEIHPATVDMIVQAKTLKAKLQELLTPMEKLSRILLKRLQDDDGRMDADTRRRYDALASSLERRGHMTLRAWINMLEHIETGQSGKGFVDWMEIERVDGKSIDVGVYRHYIDPMKPFATSIKPHVHGLAITSATMRDRDKDDTENWAHARQNTGAQYLSADCHEKSFLSPFNYPAMTKVFILNDVNKSDLAQVAGAYQTLFTASNGGALGLFTAVQRLRAVHNRIQIPLEERGLSLYAQHADEMDAGTLVDIFREDVNACLLGTDGVRDGVDVPGESLRLIVFDRVPWPRPTILHKARRAEFHGREYDDMLTRLKLKQAFGRLIRSEKDRGIFVILDASLPSRLLEAFPEGVEIVKCGLSQATEEIKGFYKNRIKNSK